jgi:glycyl-tRNA synthetase beta chain
MLGEQVVDMRQLSVNSGNETRGHRFHHPGKLQLASTNDYPSVLQEQGHVIASFSERRHMVRNQVEQLAQEAGGIAHIDDGLLDEVTALVEWPAAQTGNFDPRYLEVPAEALVSAMQDHQKYFPVRDSAGKLLPHFIFVANIESSNPSSVQAGNERVINARFADARFFWDSDRKVPLLDRTQALRNVVFHNRLGSVYDRVQRIARLAVHISDMLGSDTGKAERAAQLAKSDLLSGMVYEFPDLQGIMGRYYAIEQGEDDEVADAIREQYLPRFAGDDLPATVTGQALSIADKIDSLVGIFSIGETPTGDKDPFALRRAAIGVLRIIIEMSIDLDLRTLLLEAARNFGLEDQAAEQLAETVLGFVLERLQSYYADQGYTAAHINSVLQRRPSRPLDFDARLMAVRNFSLLAEAESLAAANKRIRNILRKSAPHSATTVDQALLAEPAEQALYRHVQQLAGEVEPLFAAGDYSRALSRLATLRPAVDDFFDNVMVMDEDERLRNNRLALLDTLSALFLRTADLSLLQT